ncbi:MAG: protein translocase subunit SecD [Chloroflexi bacterium]|nr:protein translocase subunit SecD [Chloroflexota bacterium]
MDRTTRTLIIVLILYAIAIWIALPIEHPTLFGRDLTLKLGLDLKGGIRVLLEADVPPGEKIDSQAMEAVRTIIENRVNGLGVSEAVVQIQGDRRIIVEIPGIENPEDAIAAIKSTGLLEFIEVPPDHPVRPGQYVRTTEGDPKPRADIPEDALPGPDAYVYKTIMTGKYLRTARVVFDPTTGAPQVEFELNNEGAKIFKDYTSKHVGDVLAIVLDKQVISAPVIKSVIPNGRGVITGDFTVEEAKALAVQLRYGALPIPMRVVAVDQIGPTLGKDSIRRSVVAGIVGVLAVLLFMLVYYRLPGLLADLALILFALLNISLFKLIPVTLTLPGIAGFLLATGMAVDANILIFERMKEEIRRGKPLRPAVEAGFKRAWTSILDSNLSTIITSLILYQFGSTFGATAVKGFALNLALGVALSMFTAVWVTRTFMRFVFYRLPNDVINNPLILDVKVPKGEPKWKGLFTLVQKRKYFYALSAAIIIPGLIAMLYLTATVGTPVKLGIDFTGGAYWEIRFDHPVLPGEVYQVLSKHGLDPVVQTLNDGRTVAIRMKPVDDELKRELMTALKEEIGPFEELQFRSIGPSVGREVTKAAAIAVLAASLAILAFITWAFRNVPHPVRFGVSAIVAMIHDVLVTTGIFAILGIFRNWEADALFLTALLTVIGFSVQDTIVVFDRIRENAPKYKGESFETLANRSLLETIHRSLATQLNAIFVMIAILLFGGATVQRFIAVMLIGLISGTYSSIFNAVPILVSWEMGELGKIFPFLKGGRSG